MARQGMPWAVVITIVVSTLVAAGAVAASAALRDRAGTTATTTTTTTTTTSGVGVDGCVRKPCTVLADMPVGAARVQLVVDSGGASGRLRIGGGGASKVIEATITSMGATFAPDSLQCVADTLSACVLRGRSAEGVVGQVVAGRSAQWSELAQPFLSDAGYLAIAQVTADVGPEILVAQHRCQRGTQDCATTPVYVRVYNLQSQELGCTEAYRRLESLPDWPTVTLKKTDLRACA
ncbi:hypothetical protein [Actinophytocola sp.]|uniref:hypothetical protein n=1 Tax=Actinophytocola sp. TaxID=1872138 RepID=UPI00389A487F